MRSQPRLEQVQPISNKQVLTPRMLSSSKQDDPLPEQKPPENADPKPEPKAKTDDKPSDPLLEDSMVFSDRKNLDDYIIGKQIG